MSEGISHVRTANGSLPHVGDAISTLRTALQRFDPSRVNELLPYKYEVTTAFRGDVAKRIKEINKNSLVLAACVLKQFIGLEEITWDEVDAALAKNPVIELEESLDINRSEHLNKDGLTSGFCENGSVHTDTVSEVRSWIIRALRDKQIITELQLDTELIRDIVRVASSCVDELAKSTNGENNIHEKTVFSIGVLRFPDAQQFCFTLYEIKLMAYIDTRKVMFDDVDFHGLSLLYRSKAYVRESQVLNKLAPSTVDVAITSACDFYQKLPSRPLLNAIVSDHPNLETAAGTLPKLAEVVQKSGDAIHQYDLVSAQKAAIHCDMAADFGDTREESIGLLRDDTVIALASVHRMIINSKEINYNEVDEMLNDNLLLTKSDDVVTRFDKIHKDGHNYQCYENGKPIESVTNEIRTWVYGLIYDEDIKTQLTIDPEDIVRVLEATCRHHDQIGQLPGAQEYFSRDIVDVACLQFPDDTREYFQLSRIKISAFADCRRSEFDKHLRKYMRGLAKKKDKLDKKEEKEKASRKETEEPNDLTEEQSLDVSKVTNDAKESDDASENSDADEKDEEEEEKKEEEEEEDDDDDDDDIIDIDMDTCGLIGEFQSVKYVANLEHTSMLSDKVRKIALKQGYAVFGLVRD